MTITRLADAILDEYLERHPEAATQLGDHRFDDRLDDRSEASLDDEARWVSRRPGDLSDLPLAPLDPAHSVDVQILRTPWSWVASSSRSCASTRVTRWRPTRHRGPHLARPRVRTARRPAALPGWSPPDETHGSVQPPMPASWP